MNVLFSDFSFYGHYAFRVLSRWPVILTSFPTAFSTSFSISSSRSGGDVAYQIQFRPRTLISNFGVFMFSSKDSLSRFVAALRRLLIQIIITRTFFIIFVCLVYDYRVFIRVSVLFSLRFNLNFTRIFASFTLQILF